MKHFLTTGGEFLAKKPGFKLVGRDDDLKRLSAVLLRSKASSVILVGPGGVGATALCMGLQASKDSDAVPYDIVVKRLHWLQPEIFSVPDVKAEFDAVLKILAETSDSILLIEDARDFINNCQSTGNPLFLSALNALIRDNKTQVIFETRDDDLDFVLKASGDMRELYTMIDLEEPMGDDLVAIALNSAQSLEKHHGIKINHDAVLKAIELTNKYRTRDHSLSRAQPERTSNLIDRAYASFRLDSHGHVGPEDQEKIKRYYNNARAAEIQLVALRDELNKIEIAEKSAPPAVETNSGELSAIDTFDRHTREGGMDSPAVSAKKREIINLDEARAENQRLLEEITARVNADLELSVEDILTEFSRLSGISANKLNEDEREKLKNLAALLRTRIYGQDPIIDSVADAIKVRSCFLDRLVLVRPNFQRHLLGHCLMTRQL